MTEKKCDILAAISDLSQYGSLHKQNDFMNLFKFKKKYAKNSKTMFKLQNQNGTGKFHFFQNVGIFGFFII